MFFNSALANPLIPAGSYTIGVDGRFDESPAHTVHISASFIMQYREVTQQEYAEVTGRNPSRFAACGPECPVEGVTWSEALDYANKMSLRDGLEPCYELTTAAPKWVNLECKGWRLPTESEWEAAAQLGQFGGRWSTENSGLQTQRTCKSGADSVGLCDLLGNVSEWVWDLYGPYPSSRTVDYTGPTIGELGVVRGGAWSHEHTGLMPHTRYSISRTAKASNIGFRLVRRALQ